VARSPPEGGRRTPSWSSSNSRHTSAPDCERTRPSSKISLDSELESQGNFSRISYPCSRATPLPGEENLRDYTEQGCAQKARGQTFASEVVPGLPLSGALSCPSAPRVLWRSWPLWEQPLRKGLSRLPAEASPSCAWTPVRVRG